MHRHPSNDVMGIHDVFQWYAAMSWIYSDIIRNDAADPTARVGAMLYMGMRMAHKAAATDVEAWRWQGYS